LIVPVIILSLLAIMFAFFQPLSPQLERTASRISETTVAAREAAKAKVVGAVTSCFTRRHNADEAQPSDESGDKEHEEGAASAGKEGPVVAAEESDQKAEAHGSAPASLARSSTRLPRASTFNSHWLGSEGEDDDAEERAAVGAEEEYPDAALSGDVTDPHETRRRPLASSSTMGRELAKSTSLARSTLRFARKSVHRAAELLEG
jgi:hypothetical protein